RVENLTLKTKSLSIAFPVTLVDEPRQEAGIAAGVRQHKRLGQFFVDKGNLPSYKWCSLASRDGGVAQL
ncbi:MAG TPA: hypothetical protein DCE18_19660, partial [Syntrophobacteraceae bacterium]|nr:hypothetical protein [Syntrophobacteraceae bacterium]